MMKTSLLLLALALIAAASSAAVPGEFCPGTGAELRVSSNYLLADTLGQFVVGESFAPDAGYACGRIEHGCWHSDIHIASVAEIKQTPNNYWVDAYAKVVTAGSDQLYREFYVSDQDRSGAIRVYLGTNPLTVSEGDMIDVSGVIKGTAASRYVDYPVVTVRFPDAMILKPFLTSNQWLGGAGTDMLLPGGSGLLNTGFLMRTCGRVTYVDPATPCKFFYIDDGTGFSDGQIIGGRTMRGIRVWISSLAAGNTITPPALNDCVAVTGICAAYSLSGKTYVQVRPRQQADITTY